MTGDSIRTVAPGGTIGMLGGGQLGRMTALAAAQLGYKTHVFSPDADSPCAQVSAFETVARYSDHEALAKFARSVDAVTLEWENIPVQTLAFLAKFVPVHPGPGVLAIAQDRLLEKDFVNRLGIATAPWEPARCPGQAATAYQTIGTPCVMKSARMGYDGKGQIKLTGDTAPVDAWKSIGGVDAIVEGFVDFALEVSVIVVRGQDGAMVAYPAVENRHANHILDETIAPAAIAPETAAEAERVALRIADALRLVGVLAVEMFVTRDGGVLVNELAPRPHNSGHWTMDACASSQFEQLVRAVCGLPLGSVERVADAVMKNLIGDDVESWPELMAEPGARLHLYGKAEARPGRKMGHVTRLKPLNRAP